LNLINPNDLRGKYGTYKCKSVLTKGGMGKIFKAEVISYNQHMFDKEYGKNEKSNGYIPVKVGDIVAIKSVQKSNINVENEAMVLKHIKKTNINNPVARFANLYDEWD